MTRSQVITLYNVPTYISSKCCCYAHWTFFYHRLFHLAQTHQTMLFYIQNSNGKTVIIHIYLRRLIDPIEFNSNVIWLCFKYLWMKIIIDSINQSICHLFWFLKSFFLLMCYFIVTWRMNWKLSSKINLFPFASCFFICSIFLKWLINSIGNYCAVLLL